MGDSRDLRVDEALAAADTPTLPHGEPPPADGARIPRCFGDYELLEEIARGGMGIVWKARQVSLNRLVAVKMILSGQLAREADVKRFRAEAEAAANLDHPNILPIYDVGEHEGQHYFSMKLIEGGSLADFVGARTASKGLADRDAVELLANVARAIHFAHQRGILHRDLKPANILLQNAERGVRNAELKTEASPQFRTPHSALRVPFVTDFGLARRVEGDSSLTQSGAILGTPAYMAPEQARAQKQLSTAVDVYSLGAILYEALAGRPPFVGDTPLDTVMHAVERDAPDPRSLNPAADRDLSLVALKCLEKDAAKRYGSAEALAEDLERWLRGEPILARRASAVERLGKWAKRRPAVAALSAAVVAVFVFGMLATLFFAIQSKRRADVADANLKLARESEERTKDTLCRSYFDQARALRLAGQPGWRAKALENIKQATALRQRERTLPEENLPSLADLRGEAVMVLLRTDAWEVQEVSGTASSHICLSHDGRRAAAVVDTKDGRVLKVFDTTNGNVLAQLAPKESEKRAGLAELACMALNPDGSVLAFCNGTSVEFWELPSGKVNGRFNLPKLTEAQLDPEADIVRVDYTPDGRRLLATLRIPGDKASDQAALVVWDLNEAGKHRVLAKFPVTTQTGFAHLGVSFSPDSSRVTFADNKQLTIRAIAADQSVVIPVPNCWSVAWHPSAPLLALAQQLDLNQHGWRLAVWDVERRAELFHWDLDSAAPPQLAFRPDGKLLAIRTKDGLIRFYGAFDGRERLVVEADEDFQPRLQWTPQGRLLSSGDNEDLRVWEVTPDLGLEERVRSPLPPNQLEFSLDGRWLAFNFSTLQVDVVWLWDRRAGRRVTELVGVNGGLQFSPDGRRLMQNGGDDIAVWDVPAGGEPKRYESRKNKEGAAVGWAQTFFARNGTLLELRVADDGAGLLLWNVADNRPETILSAIKLPAAAAADARMSWHDRWLTATDQAGSEPPTRCRVWELPGPRLAADFDLGPLGAGRAPAPYLFPTMISADGRWMLLLQSAGPDSPNKEGAWILVGLPKGDEIYRWAFNSAAGLRTSIESSADSRLLARLMPEGYVEVWDVETRQQLVRWQSHGGKSLYAVDFAPEGWVATSANNVPDIHILKLDAARKALEELGLGW